MCGFKKQGQKSFCTEYWKKFQFRKLKFPFSKLELPDEARALTFAPIINEALWR